jgi:hypothetical protein
MGYLSVYFGLQSGFGLLQLGNFLKRNFDLLLVFRLFLHHLLAQILHFFVVKCNFRIEFALPLGDFRVG